MVTVRDTIPYGTRHVKVGTTVTWTDTCAGPCTVTFNTIPVTSGTMVKGDTFSHTFTDPGNYPYHCEFDPAEMQGNDHRHLVSPCALRRRGDTGDTRRDDRLRRRTPTIET